MIHVTMAACHTTPARPTPTPSSSADGGGARLPCEDKPDATVGYVDNNTRAGSSAFFSGGERAGGGKTSVVISAVTFDCEVGADDVAVGY